MENEIILIGPSSSREDRCQTRERYVFPPLGLLSISSFLKLHGYTVVVADLLFEDYSREGFKQYLRLLAKKPLMIGISVFTDCVEEVLEIAFLAKEVFPHSALVLGGPHASFAWEELMEEHSIDFIVRGEAESKLLSFLEHLQNSRTFAIEHVPDLVYRNQVGSAFEVRKTHSAPYIESLDILPFPDYKAWSQVQQYSKIFSIVSTRGCPGDCIFCASRALSGKNYRFHSAHWLFSLLLYYWKEFKFDMFTFMDDTFLANKKRMRMFCHLLRHHFASGHPLRWACKSRADMIQHDDVQLLKSTGCISIHIGVESGDEDILKSIKKNISLSDVFTSLKILKQHGIRVDCSFIIGHPQDTMATIEKTLILAQTIEDLHYGNSAVGISTPYPGTELLERAEELNLSIKVHDWSYYTLQNPIYETEHITAQQLRKALYYYEQEKDWKKNPGLSNTEDQEIERIRKTFIQNLTEEEYINDTHG